MTARPGPDGQTACATGHTTVIVVAAAQSLLSQQRRDLSTPDTLHMLRRPGSTEHIKTRSDTYVL
jgi:hypothetical protein